MTEGVAPREALHGYVSLWERSRGAVFYHPGIYTSTATFFRLCVRTGAVVRVSPFVSIVLACVLP
eukprot:2472185-Prymnesium_polylepis.1